MASEAKPRVLFDRQRIAVTVRRLAAEIKKDYQSQDILLIGVLKGAFVFLADLIRLLDLPLEVDFIGLSSYARGRESSGKIQVTQPASCPIKGRDVLVIEDIVDTGLTTAFLLDYLSRQKPASLRLCTLLDKPSRRRVPVTIDYLGFSVPDKFVVGYGLDCGEKYRNLPDICFLEDN